MIIKRLRAQSTIEYVMLVVILIGAFIAMKDYIKRGIQGRWHSSVDDLGDQYDPSLVNSMTNYSLLSNSDSIVQTVPGTDTTTGQSGYYTNRIDNTHSVETKTAYTAVGATAQ